MAVKLGEEQGGAIQEMGRNDGPDDPIQAPDLARMKRLFSEARDLTQVARSESVEDIDYYDSKQWSPHELQALRDRRQPDIVINRIKPAVNGIIGVTVKAKSQARAFPRTPKSEEIADVATDALQYIADADRWVRTKQACFLDMLVPGSMAVLVGCDPSLKVTITQIRWEELFYDPRSRFKDFKDARYLGIAKWMYAEQVKALYPDKADEIEGALMSSGMGVDQSFQDRPLSGTVQSWSDRRNRRVLIVEMYIREAGKWMKVCFHGNGILEHGPSPYHDDNGQPHCPIEAQSAYVDRDNRRYGAVRDMRGPQDEINKRRSKLLHLLSVSQIEMVDINAIEANAETAREEAARPDGIIPPGYRKVSTADMAAGQAQLLAEAKSEIERQAPNPAILGRLDSDASGRALLARQQSGLVELATIYGDFDDWELRVYRQMWARAKQYWRSAMWIRVTDDEDAPRFVGLNQPKGVETPMLGQDGQPQIDPKTGKPAVQEGPAPLHPDMIPPYDQYGMQNLHAGKPHPYAGQPVLGYKNNVAEMDVDITLETLPDSGTIAQEQFTDLMQLVGSNPAYAQQVPFELILQLSSIPNKRMIADKIKAFQAEQQAKNAQAQQIAQQLALQKAQAEIADLKSKADRNDAAAGMDQSKTDIGHVNALLAAHQAGVDSVGVAPMGPDSPGAAPMPMPPQPGQQPQPQPAGA